jgi:hypothetical protein
MAAAGARGAAHRRDAREADAAQAGSVVEVIFWRTPLAPPIACWPGVGMRGGNAAERGDEFKTAFTVLFGLIVHLPGPSNQGSRSQSSGLAGKWRSELPGVPVG